MPFLASWSGKKTFWTLIRLKKSKKRTRTHSRQRDSSQIPLKNIIFPCVLSIRCRDYTARTYSPHQNPEILFFLCQSDFKDSRNADKSSGPGKRYQFKTGRNRKNRKTNKKRFENLSRRYSAFYQVLLSARILTNTQP